MEEMEDNLEQARIGFYNNFLSEYQSEKKIENLKREYANIRYEIKEVQDVLIGDENQDDMAKLEILVIKEQALRDVLTEKGVDIATINFEDYRGKAKKSKSLKGIFILALLGFLGYMIYTGKIKLPIKIG